MTKDCPHPRYYSYYWKVRENHSDLSNYGLPVCCSKVDLEGLMVVICGSVQRLEMFRIEMFLVSDRDKFKSF
jgi:hypothetical protein